MPPLLLHHKVKTSPSRAGYASSGPRATRVNPAKRDYASRRLKLCALLMSLSLALPVGLRERKSLSDRRNRTKRASATTAITPIPEYEVNDERWLQSDRFVVMEKSTRRLHVYRKERVIPAAVGRRDGDKRRVGDERTPESRAGRVFPVARKMHTASGSPFGTRYLELNTSPWRGIAIHGTDAPDTVGTAASHGCLRLFNSDIEWLYDRLPTGSPIVIIP